MTVPLRFSTLATAVEHAADPIKKSRFVAIAAPVSSEGQALQQLEAVKQRHSDARHHCWAYRLADGRSRSSDDGEPGGSAGRPILAQIEGHDLLDVVVVVVRWFGGVKLGVGGLIRAYGGTAGQALDRGEVIEVAARAELVVRYAYDDTGPVQAVIGARGLQVSDTRWGEAVELVLDVEVESLDEVVAALRDATSGRVVLSGAGLSGSPAGT